MIITQLNESLAPPSLTTKSLLFPFVLGGGDVRKILTSFAAFRCRHTKIGLRADNKLRLTQVFRPILHAFHQVKFNEENVKKRKVARRSAIERSFTRQPVGTDVEESGKQMAASRLDTKSRSVIHLAGIWSFFSRFLFNSILNSFSNELIIVYEPLGPRFLVQEKSIKSPRALTKVNGGVKHFQVE